MWNKILYWITLRRFQWQHRQSDVDIISFTRALSNAQKILICLPWDFTEFFVARYVLKYISRDDQKHSITYIVPNGFNSPIPTRPQDTVIHANGTSRTRSGLFSETFERQIIQHDFHVAADFSRTFDLGTSMLCWRSGAPLRIGLESPYSHLFFNIEFEQEGRGFPLENAYRSIQKTLAIEDK